METGSLHVPVMVREVLQTLKPEAGGWFVDCTLGLGGHARALLESSPSIHVLGVDRDHQALVLAREALAPFGDRVRFAHANFKDAAVWGALLPEAPSGVLVDLGLSGYQLKSGRGFSFTDRTSLDMRMDESEGQTAAEFINGSGEDELARVIRRFGEEPRARSMARAIVAARPLHDAASLAEVIESAVPSWERGRIHPATKAFQAIRIHLNRELEGLADFLEAAVTMLRLGGRIVVLAYHSLEDRIVKQTFAALAKGCICPPKLPVCACGRVPLLAPVTRKALRPGPEEVARNHASRSARLRAGERV